MSGSAKRVAVTLEPEMLSVLEQLKNERFSEDSWAEMLRYFISRGLESADEIPQKNVEK